jgi:hypothetical protein
MSSLHHPSRRDLARLCLGTTLSAVAAAAPQKSPPGARKSGTQSGMNAIYVADLSRCEPAAALTRSFEAGRWQLIDYETEDGVKGVMAAAYPEHRCAELTLPLNARGPHEVYLGINYTKARYPEWSPYGLLDVKLSGDDGFRRVAVESETVGADGKLKIGESSHCYKSIQEAYWRTADLTGKSLVFRQPHAPYDRPEHANISNLSYVKLVPLTEADRKDWEQDRTAEGTKRLAMLFCTGQFTGHTHGTYTYHPTSEQWFRDEFAPYLDSDFKLLIFEAMRGDFCLFKTRIGDVGNEENRWEGSWVDPLGTFTRLAHEHGMKILASLRMIGPQYPMNREPIARARYYWKHPEWAKRDRDGVPLSNWSLAFPQVRQYWLSLLRETLDYGTDGVQLHLNRSEPFVYYEEPVLREFRETFQEDPRKLPESDPRWQEHCAGYVTEYLREVRKLVNEKPGRELSVTVHGKGPERDNCDVERWLREGLVDYVMPSPNIDVAVLKRWRSLAGDRIHLWPDLMPRTQLSESYAKLAKTYLEAGADGFCVWDGERRAPRISEWAAVLQLGHLDRLDRLTEKGHSYYRRVPMKYLAGLSLNGSFGDG